MGAAQFEVSPATSDAPVRAAPREAVRAAESSMAGKRKSLHPEHPFVEKARVKEAAQKKANGRGVS